MKRVTGLAAICRAMDGVAAAPSVAGSWTCERRLFQTALFSSSTNNNSSARSHWLFSFNRISNNHPGGRVTSAAIAGTMLFSVAAIAVVEEVRAKEPVRSELVPKDIVLYQYEVCPFCNKVKAFLDYYDIPYKVVEVNPISKKELKWSNYKKVPVVTVDGERLIESSDIINQLRERIDQDGAAGCIAEDDEEKKWRGWVDSYLVHLLSPNIYRTTSEALESFEYITTNGNFSFSERISARYAGAAAMYLVSKKLKKKYNIADERTALYEAAETWVDALNGRDFLGGSKPNLADLAVYGVLKPVRNLRSGREMVEHTRIGDWYNRMEAAVGQTSRIQA